MTNQMICAGRRAFCGVRRGLFLSSAAATVASVSITMGSAYGQQNPSDSSAAASALEEVVVTARKRVETLQDVPTSATAFNEAALEKQMATEVGDLEYQVPNLSYFDRRDLGNFTIRGISTNIFNPGVESPMVVYVDGIPTGRNASFNQSLTGVQGIEVYRGPQGTSFGKNTISGAVNITTKQPGEEFEGVVKLGVGNYDLRTANLYLSGPLMQGVYASIDGFGVERDGYLKNAFNGTYLNDEDRKGGRLKLRAEPSDSLDITAAVDFLRSRRNATSTQLLSGAGGLLAFGDFVIGEGVWEEPFSRQTPRRTSVDVTPHDSKDLFGASLIANYRFDSGYVISSLLGYSSVENEYVDDADATEIDGLGGLVRSKSTALSEELRLVSPDVGRFKFVSGLMYWTQDADSLFDFPVGPLFRTDQTDPDGPQGEGSADTDSYAVYFDTEFKLTSQLSLDAGVRYTYESKEGRYTQDGRPDLGIIDIAEFRASPSDDAVTYDVALRYKLSNDVNTYAKVSRGFKSGGINLDLMATIDQFTFDPEFLLNYEIGLKGRFLDRRLSIDLAAYQMKYEDQQVSQFSSTFVEITNAGESTIKGFEADIAALLVSTLELRVGVGYLDATFDKFPGCVAPNGNVFDCAGDRLVYAPDWTGNVGLSYSHNLPGGSSLQFGAQWAYRGVTFYNAPNSAASRVEPYDVTNVQAGFVSAGGSWGINLWARNVTDELFATWKRDTSIPYQEQVMWNEPRMYGVEFRYSF